MATYIPNATQTTEPVESRTVESAALEFRTLKASINGRIGDVQAALDAEIVNRIAADSAETAARIAGDANLQAQNNAQDVRLTAIENALPFIGEGAVPGTVYVQRFSGTGVQTAFTLDVVPQSGNVVDIYINGLYQNKDTFSVAGAVITFSEAPPAGTDNIEVQVTVTIALGETDASLVTYGATTVGAQLDAISAAGGSNLVGFQQAGTSAIVRTVQDKLREFVSVKDFGAVGDGVADDTAAIQAAINYGGVLSARDMTIRITSPIFATVASDLVFDFQNTTIVYDGASNAAYVIRLDINGCKLSGSIQIDCALKSHKGLYLNNNTDSDSTVDLQISVSNVYKTTTALSGDGLFAEGLFSSFILNKPIFTNMVMAVGAGVSGISGIRGATIKALSGTRYPKYVEINSPQVTDVYSEDATYQADQDGIAVFSPEDSSAAPDYDPFEQKAFVTGGVMKNCMGRAFKFQNQYAEVTGTHFERDRALSVAPWGFEVDFQTGGGVLTNATARYVNGSVPLTFCNLSTPQTAAFVVPYGSASGIKIFTDAVAPNCMRDVVKLSQRTTTAGNRIFVSDVTVIGNVLGVLGLNPLSESAPFFVSATGLRAAPLEGLVYAYGSAALGGTVNLSDCFNLGLSTVPSYRRTSSTMVYSVSGVNVIGFADYKTVDTGYQGQSLRVHSIAASNQIKSGILRPVAFTLDDGASFALPPTALNVQTNMILVTVGGSRNSQAIFSCDSSQVIALAAGSDWTVGTTTEPLTGTYRIWSGVSGQTISNHSGVTRTFTVLMFG